jgi:hypothetical protein
MHLLWLSAVLCLSAGALLYATSLYLSAGVLLYSASPGRTAFREPPQTGPLLSSGFEESKDGGGAAFLPAIHAIPRQPVSRPSAGAPQARNQEPPATEEERPAVNPPRPTWPLQLGYQYDVIAATEDERRAADEVSKQFHADEEEIFAQMRSGELDKRDVKPALLRRIQAETESLNEIFGADRTTKLREAASRPGG